ncbi:hypothetical protein STXM2123_3564 [Streptomyces sp. F-3]|nr:hypothetical protein STXM2123_3564 [Streptomyces sp. F-3]
MAARRAAVLHGESRRALDRRLLPVQTAPRQLPILPTLVCQ